VNRLRDFSETVSLFRVKVKPRKQLSSGFTSLLFLFVLAPLVDLSWLLAEIIAAIRLARRHRRAMSFVMPGLALAVLLESVVADIFLLSQAKM
jgi:hypothetical protein